MIKTILSIFFIIQFSFAQQWQRLNGEFYQIEYPQGFEKIADSLATITEYALPKLCQIIDYDLSHYIENPVKIYLTNSKDISNGFALENRVVIYATSSEYMDRWTGKANWYQRVTTHELVHNIMFRKTKRFTTIFGHTVQYALDAVPRWFSEGLAQYYAEEWDFYRSDARLRNAVLSGQLSYGRFVNDLSLSYAAGHAFIRYLSQEYGDKKLVELMSYSFGFSYNFYDAFSATYGMSVVEAFAQFTKTMIIYYGNKYHDIEDNAANFKLEIKGQVRQFLPFNTDTTQYVILTKISKRDNFLTGLFSHRDKQSYRPIRRISDDIATDIVISPNDQKIAYGSDAIEYKEDNFFTSRNWFVQDVKTGNEVKIQDHIRAIYATFVDDQTLVLVEQPGEGSNLISYDLNSNTKTSIFNTHITIGEIKSTGPNSFIFLGQEDHQLRHIYKLENRKIEVLTPMDQDVGQFLYQADSILFYEVLESDLKTVWKLNLKSKTHKRVYVGHDDFALQSVSSEGKLILRTRPYSSQFNIKTIDLDSLEKMNVVLPEIEKSPYSQWKFKATEVTSTLGQAVPIKDSKRTTEEDIYASFDMVNGFTFVFPNFDKDQNFLGGLSTTWFDPMQRQAITLNTLFDFTNTELKFLLFRHEYNKHGLRFITSALYLPAIFKFEEIKDLGVRRFMGKFEIEKPIYIGRNDRSRIKPSLYINYSRSKITKNFELSTVAEKASYSGFGGEISYKYELPSTLSSFLSKSRYGLSLDLYKSVTSDLEFSTLSLNTDFEHYLFTERFTIDNKLNWIKLEGKQSPHDWVGIDRFYTYNSFKDIGLSRSIRGFENDLYASQFLWHSTEFSFLLADNTNWKVVFIPLNNLTIKGFVEGAEINAPTNNSIISYGAELMFGITGARYGVGIATTEVDQPRSKTESIYIRINVEL